MKLKLAGSALFHNTWDFTEERILPYVEHAIRAFGFNRIVTGSDCPVILGKSSVIHLYALLFQAAINVGASEEDLALIFQRNAEAFYQI